MTDKDKKIKKNKGPIRTGAVVPFLIVATLVTAFNIFFLDSTIKKSIEFFGTKVNGAEVNVSDVDISITDLKVNITKIEFTNAKDPHLNTFEIGTITFSALWDAVLRGKLVINIAKAENILFKTKRKSKGYVVPESEKVKNSQMTKEVLAKTQKEFEGNILGDIASLISGNSISKGARVEDNLKSKQKYEELSKEVDTRSKNLDQAFKNLPKSAELKSLEKRLGSIKWKDLGNITKAPRVLNDINKLKKDVDETKKKYDTANKQVKENLKFINNGQKEIQALVKEDIAGVQKRMKLPKMDSKSIAKLLFGQEAFDNIKVAEGYYGQVKEYLPPKKTKAEKEAAKPDYTKHPRGKGRDYQFGTPKSYPPIWIQKVLVDSKNDQGQIKGNITDITNNQTIVNKPTLLKVNADFIKMGYKDIVVKGLFDHRNGSRDSMDITIGTYPVDSKALSKSKSAKLVIDKARGNAIFNINFVDDVLNFKVKNYYKDINYSYDANSKAMKEVLGGIARDTKVISMEAKARGKISDLQWNIKTNLASAIQKSVNNLVSEKIKKAQKKIKDDINKSLGKSKAEFNEKLSSFKSKYEGELNKGKQKFDAFKNDIDKKKKAEEKKARGSLEKKAKDLFKGFKI